MPESLAFEPAASLSPVPLDESVVHADPPSKRRDAKIAVLSG